MAPERVLSLVVMDLRLENSGLKCNIKYFEPERSDEKLRVRWAVQSQPESFFPVGGGVAYVLDTGRVKEYPPSEDAFPQKSSDGSYFWDEGDIRPEPSLMIILIFPKGYTIAGPEPPPVSAKEFDGRLALYWVLGGDCERRVRVKWRIRALSGQLSSEIERIHRECSGPKPLRLAGFDVDAVTSILFLAADPADAVRLRLGEELREIQQKLQLAKQRDRFRLEQRMSVRAEDMSQALLDVKPQIVHFSGHGTETGEICVEDKVGKTHPIPPEALAALFRQFEDLVDCVVLNACFSESQAKAIVRHIDYVVGMRRAIGDPAALAFAVGFYQGLGAGRSVESAYELGRVQIGLQGIPEQLTPVLLKKAELYGAL